MDALSKDWLPQKSQANANEQCCSTDEQSAFNNSETIKIRVYWLGMGCIGLDWIGLDWMIVCAVWRARIPTKSASIQCEHMNQAMQFEIQWIGGVLIIINIVWKKYAQSGFKAKRN